MLLVRPIRAGDYESLLDIARESGVGFTSLPINEAILRRRIEHSLHAFAADIQQPAGEGYLCVVEDSASGTIVGTTGIESAVGLSAPFYHYHLAKVVHASRALGVHNVIDLLTLCNDYTGSSEICTLYLRPAWRGSVNGRLASRSRFLLMAEHPERFSQTVIAEMRGVSDEDGRSPFWQWLQEHFFRIDFPTADYLTGIGHKGFIAELMPKYPIYVSLLSAAAQAVIGQVHPHTVPALKLLEAEGFVSRGYVDIFDAGPTVECPLRFIRTVRRSRRLAWQIGEVGNGEPMLLANTRLQQFRCVAAPARIEDERLVLAAATARLLLLDEGEAVRCSPLVR